MRITERQLRRVIRSVIREGYEEDMGVALRSEMRVGEVREIIFNGFGRQLAIDYYKKHNDVDLSDYDPSYPQGRSNYGDDVQDSILRELIKICCNKSRAFRDAMETSSIYNRFAHNVRKGVMQCMSGNYDDLLNLGK
jgi:hypothetical protein